MTQTYFVYVITCTVNGKKYVGVSKNPDKRLRQHRKDARGESRLPIHNAIRKYGLNSFIMEVIYGSFDKNYIFKEMEPYFIKLYESNIRENGYNIAPGGFGGNTNGTSREKQSEAAKRQHADPISKSTHLAATTKANQNSETCQRQAEKACLRWGNPQFKKKMIDLFQTPEHKAKRAKASMGKRALKWELIDVNSGERIVVKNMNHWCKEKGYDAKTKQAYGYVCKKFTSDAKSPFL